MAGLHVIVSSWANAETKFKAQGVCYLKDALLRHRLLDTTVDALECGGANAIIWPVHVLYVHFYILDPHGADMLGIALILASQ